MMMLASSVKKKTFCWITSPNIQTTSKEYVNTPYVKTMVIAVCTESFLFGYSLIAFIKKKTKGKTAVDMMCERTLQHFVIRLS